MSNRREVLFYLLLRVSHSGQITVVRTSRALATAVGRIRTKTNDAQIPRGLEQGTKRLVEPRTRPFFVRKDTGTATGSG